MLNRFFLSSQPVQYEFVVRIPKRNIDDQGDVAEKYNWWKSWHDKFLSICRPRHRSNHFWSRISDVSKNKSVWSIPWIENVFFNYCCPVLFSIKNSITFWSTLKIKSSWNGKYDDVYQNKSLCSSYDFDISTMISLTDDVIYRSIQGRTIMTRHVIDT